MDFKNVMYNHDNALVHRPTGRRFFYVPAHNVQMQVQGLEITVTLTETWTEVINGLLCPVSIPTTFIFDEWDVGSIEAIMPEAFHDKDRLRQADEENRIGIASISRDLWVEYGAVLRSAHNINIKSDTEDELQVMVVFTSPDIEPVKDGHATPEYLLAYDEQLNLLSFELVKTVKL